LAAQKRTAACQHNDPSTIGIADAAGKLPVPDKPKLKDPKDFSWIGKPFRHFDTPGKTNGKAIYGIDAMVPNMKFASLKVCPVFGGKVRQVDDSVPPRRCPVSGSLRSDWGGLAPPADRSCRNCCKEGVSAMRRIVSVVIAVIIIASVGLFGWWMFNPGPLAFARGSTVALTDYQEADPTGVPADLANADIVKRGGDDRSRPEWLAQRPRASAASSTGPSGCDFRRPDIRAVPAAPGPLARWRRPGCVPNPFVPHASRFAI
jgi:hypothetical protein